MSNREVLQDVSNKRQSMGTALSSKAGNAKGNRRTTLAGYSKPGRKSMAGRKSLAPSSRKSMGPGRRSSIFTKGGAYKDPRPMDKAFNKRNISKVQKFLIERGYDAPLSHKTLSAPSSKEFVHILTFLAQEVDPNHTFGQKVEEEVPAFFKKVLKYPVTISKSNMSSVGAPHTWPSFLAALAWFVELLQYSERVAENKMALEEDGYEDAMVGDRAFYKYLSKGYGCFMAGDDEGYQELEDMQEGEYTDKNEKIKAETEQVVAETELARAQLQKLVSQQSPLVVAQQKNDELVQTIEKFGALITSLEEQTSRASEMVKIGEEKLAASKSELGKEEALKAELQVKLDHQEVDVDEFRAMKQNETELEKTLSALGDKRTSAQQEKYQKEIDMTALVTALEDKVAKFNHQAKRLHMIPADAKFANGVDYQLRFHKDASDASKMLDNDIANTLRPSLSKLKETLSKRIEQTSDECWQAQMSASRMEEEKNNKQDEVHALETRLRTLESNYRMARETVTEEMQNAANQAEELSQAVMRMKTANQQSIVQSQKTLDLLHAEAREAEIRMEQEKKALNTQIVSMLDTLATHKQHVQQRLSELHQRFQQVKDELA